MCRGGAGEVFEGAGPAPAAQVAVILSSPFPPRFVFSFKTLFPYSDLAASWGLRPRRRRRRRGDGVITRRRPLRVAPPRYTRFTRRRSAATGTRQGIVVSCSRKRGRSSSGRGRPTRRSRTSSVSTAPVILLPRDAPLQRVLAVAGGHAVARRLRQRERDLDGRRPSCVG